MKTWAEVRENINSITKEEKSELDFMADLISKLVIKRTELGISQRELAEMSGVKQSAIARLESLRATPQIDTLYKLLRPLKLKINLVDE